MAVLSGLRQAIRDTALLLLISTLPARSNGQVSMEYQVKAAYLANFAVFVEWPGGKPPENACIVGSDPFGAALDESLSKAAGGSRPIGVRRVGDGQSLRGCDLLFVSGDTHKRLDLILSAAARSGTLTVGESPAFMEHGGLISLQTEDRRVRVAVNVDLAGKNGFKVSSRLLRVASVYKRDQP